MSTNSLPKTFEDAVARFVGHMHTRHRVTPVVVSADQSEYKDGKWKLSDEYGRPLAYVADDGTVS